MLQTDAFSAILFIVVALFVLHQIKPTQARCHWEDDSRVGYYCRKRRRSYFLALV